MCAPLMRYLTSLDFLKTVKPLLWSGFSYYGSPQVHCTASETLVSLSNYYIHVESIVVYTSTSHKSNVIILNYGHNHQVESDRPPPFYLARKTDPPPFLCILGGWFDDHIQLGRLRRKKPVGYQYHSTSFF